MANNSEDQNKESEKKKELLTSKKTLKPGQEVL